MPLDLQPTYNKIAREIETILKLQVPVDTGDLRDSISVTVNQDGFEIDYEDYGNFTDDGTGSYYEETDNIFAQPFNPNPGKGEGGIKPRHWTNFGKAEEEKMYEEIEKSITEYLEEELDKII
jgi:hypothetical protein